MESKGVTEVRKKGVDSMDNNNEKNQRCRVFILHFSFW